MIHEVFEQAVLKGLGADSYKHETHIQSLWSGYGSIDRIRVNNGIYETAILKRISPMKTTRAQSSLSHQRKLNSYKIEIEFYKRFSGQCDDNCRVPAFISALTHDEEHIIILEDLDRAGFPLRRHSLTKKQENACLRWLAYFHARFMNVQPEGLWDIGTYWHLDTRQEEFHKMPSGTLKENAHAYDTLLNKAQFKTLVHGDAKPANFCFSADDGVAAVDFQYVGGGCGMKDITYFFWGDTPQNEHEYLETYFNYLDEALNHYGSAIDFPALKQEWSELYPVAKADFHRFLQGWML